MTELSFFGFQLCRNCDLGGACLGSVLFGSGGAVAICFFGMAFCFMV